MPRVTFVKKARKDNPVCKRGESYYWWKFRYGGKRYSLTRPRPSQLTQSAYYGTVRSIGEMIEDADPTDADEFESLVDEVRSEIECLRDETQEKLDNMSEYGLEYSPTGEMIQERIDALENAECELEVDEFMFDEEEFDEDEPDLTDYDPTDFENEEEMVEMCEDDHEDWEQRQEEHREAEEERRANEFSEWLSDAKDQLTEAVYNCEV